MAKKSAPSAKSGAEGGISYSSAGVDVKKVKGIQDQVNKLILTTSNEYSIPLAGHYAGLFRYPGKTGVIENRAGTTSMAPGKTASGFGQGAGATFTMHTDGVGTKVLVAQSRGIYDTVGIDAVAMNVNDLVCIGSRPIVATDYLALAKADEELILEVVKGLVEGCRQSKVALIGGETAIMPDIIKGGERPFDLAVTCVGIIERELTGKDMKVGDALVGLRSSGLHSNGFTLARRVLDEGKWGKTMLAPTKIYSEAALEMLKFGQVHGIAHITGGAFSKLSRIGKHAGVGFLLDNMPKPQAEFEEIAKTVQSDYEMHRTFNMGVGMVVACPQSELSRIIEIAKKHGIEAGQIGEVVAGHDVTLQKDGKKISLL
ncbi:phosphoribosylformylglycinamidine cyclo-ligase [Candidatus Parvarchaeota archaeon]|nr:phosphoribosylformylglycinamidine cyclo-ligase [Candidatus Parvarchaeota archaeon]